MLSDLHDTEAVQVAARHLALNSEDIRIHSASGRCENLPLNVFIPSPAVTEANCHPIPVDVTFLNDYWRRYPGMMYGMVHDLTHAVIRQFIRHVVFVEPEPIVRGTSTPCIYLANHQTGIESMIFLYIMATLTTVPIKGVAKHELRNHWLSRISSCFDLRFKHGSPIEILYLDRADPTNVIQSLQDFSRRVGSTASSLLVHVEGSRSLVCGESVSDMSAVLIDLARTLGYPIVPVRFIGGLPHTGNDKRLDFPYRYGKQDIYIGKPIAPEEIAGLYYKECKERILSEINHIGFPLIEERPIEDETDFSQRVAACVDTRGCSEVDAVWIECLTGIGEHCDETRTILKRFDDDSRTTPLGPGSILSLMEENA